MMVSSMMAMPQEAITVGQDATGFLVSRMGRQGEILGQIRFGQKADADEFAELWRDWTSSVSNRH